MATALTWFEIPTSDLERAVKFYETVLGIQLQREVFGGTPMAIFPASAQEAGGALVLEQGRAPSGGGTLIYLDAAGKLDACLSRVVRAGGLVVSGRTDIGGPGYVAVLRDTEGNMVALHSPRDR
jgi:predicted enzyme related to lactoylglutathione lyase